MRTVITILLMLLFYKTSEKGRNYMNEVLNVIKRRRSIRKYLPKQIKEEDLKLIIESAVYAPSAHNDQPWHFTVIQNKDIIQMISDKSKELAAESEVDWIKKMALNPDTHLTYNSPTLIIVSGNKTATAPLVDCSAAIQNMLLVAESLGIGSVWIGLIRFFFKLEDEVKKLGIPDGYEPYYGVALGYKLPDQKSITPERNLNVVNYIR